MSAASFEAGNVVWLKSGGPAMTIRWLEDEYGTMTAFCDWFVGTAQKSGKFDPVQLTKTKPEV